MSLWEGKELRIAGSYDLASKREAGVPITPDRLVDDVMRRSPETIRVFLDQKFHCVGCPIACLHTVVDACREHHADLAAFLAALNAARAAKGRRDGREPSNPAGARPE